MNNFEKYDDALARDPLEAAALAIQFASGCGSKSAAWSCADNAVKAAAEAGIALNPGRASWPDLDAMTDQLAAAMKREPETVIVSRHAGAVAWLAAQGITGNVIAQATPEDVRGKVVIGNLPLHLASLAERVGSIDMPQLAAADRGRDLTPEEMDAAGAHLSWYVVAATTQP